MNSFFVPGSVVVGVDGSPVSDRAVRWAADHAATHRRPLALLHGTGAPVVTDFGFDLADARRALRSAGRRATEHALGLVRRDHPDLEVTEHVGTEDPRAMLAAAGRTASVLVVGSRGRGPVASLLLGSVSVAVASHPACPVVVVRDSSGAEDGPVVLGVDVQVPSREATRTAHELASQSGRPLHVVHAVGDLHGLPYLDLLGPVPLRDLREEVRCALAESLAGFAEKYPDVRVSTELVDATPAAALRRASEAAALVVVGAGRSRRPLGSVSRSVVEHARCSTVVVPEEVRS